MTDKMSLAFQYCNQHIGIIYGVMKNFTLLHNIMIMMIYAVRVF